MNSEARTKVSARMIAMNEARVRHGYCRRGKELIEYRVWKHMWKRCTDPTHKSYERYGGRGIRVCTRWKSFDAFIEDMGMRPSTKHTIERIDNDKAYSPSNCIWATMKEQANNRSNNIKYRFNEQLLTATQLADLKGLNHRLVRQRLEYGWSPKDAIETPIVDNRPSLLPGQIFGRLTIIRRVANDKFCKSRYECVCACGNRIVTGSANLKKGTQSCGCLRLTSQRKNLKEQ